MLARHAQSHLYLPKSRTNTYKIEAVTINMRNVNSNSSAFHSRVYPAKSSHKTAVRGLNTGVEKFLLPSTMIIPRFGSLSAGDGVDVIQTAKTPRSALVVTATKFDTKEGMESEPSFSLIENEYQLYRSLDFSLNVEGSYRTFTSEVNFRKKNESTYNSKQTTLVLQNFVLLPWETYKVQWDTANGLNSDIIKALKEKKGRLWFRENFGDMYVSGIQKGGVFNAFVHIESEDSREREEVSVKLNAALNAGVAKGEMTSEIKQVVSSVSRRTHISVRAHQGGGDELQQVKLGRDLPEQLNSLFAHLREFPTITKTKPYKCMVELSKYPLPYDPTVRQLNIDELANMRKLYQIEWAKCKEWHAHISTVLEYSERFNIPSNVTFDDLLNFKTEIERHISKLLTLSEKCIDDITKCSPPPILNEPSWYRFLISNDYVRDQEESNMLGKRWDEYEHYDLRSNHELPPKEKREWHGTWLRRSQFTRVFDGTWNHINGGDPVEATLSIVINKDKTVTVDRKAKNSASGNPSYTYVGSLSNDGSTVRGTYSGPTVVKPNWDATIFGRPPIKSFKFLNPEKSIRDVEAAESSTNKVKK